MDHLSKPYLPWLIHLYWGSHAPLEDLKWAMAPLYKLHMLTICHRKVKIYLLNKKHLLKYVS